MQGATMGVKYIGSKAALIDHIIGKIDQHMPRVSGQPPIRVIDVFTGTTRVAQACRRRGWHVQSSDLAWASEAYANAFLIRTAISGQRIPALIEQLRIETAAAFGSTTPPAADWLTKHYCDVSGAKGGTVRMWQRDNGLRADYMRNRIESMMTGGQISKHEALILITALIFALDKVDNSVGIQQAYLKDWAKRTENALELEDLPFPSGGPPAKHQVGDCLSLVYEPADVAYLDPPYSSHSYATYYHIWDSIARWDKPAVGLKTNRRIDRVASADEFDTGTISPWNRKGGALKAFMDLAHKLPVKALLISYNDESIIPLDTLLKSFRDKYGESNVHVTRIPYQRNIMAQIGNAALYTDEHKVENTEVLIWVWKGVEVAS